MTRLLLALAALLAAGCAPSAHPEASARDVAYRGISAEGLWQLTIGGDRILFHYAEGNELSWPHPRERIEAGKRIWEAGGDGRWDPIRIEARNAPCAAPDGIRYADTLRVVRMVDGQPFVAEGCGGRILGPLRGG